MISSIKSQLTSSIGREYYQTDMVHITQLGPTCLHFEFTSSRMTLETPRKQRAKEDYYRHKMENKTQNENKLKKELYLNNYTYVIHGLL